jgi:3-oxoacyl-[acyl-carrier-protein] synthase II
MTAARRAVITGIGIVSPLGTSLAALWDNMREGRSGVARLRSFDPAGLPVQIGAELVDFDARQFIDKKDHKRLNRMVRTMHLAVAAAQLAVTDAAATFDPARLGVVFGSSTLPGDLAKVGEAALAAVADDRVGMDLRRWGVLAMPNLPPMRMLEHIPNMTASHVSIMHNAQGPNNTISQSDASSLMALGEAARMIQADRAEGVLVGGADVKVAPINLVLFTLCGRLSRRNDDPEGACRPFERDRDGEVAGEGAAVFLVEERAHALARGAKVYGEVLGFASGIDPVRRGPDLGRVIRTALADAGVAPVDVDHVNAHGSGTVLDDSWEAAGIADAFADAQSGVPVVALKSYFGNLGAGSGLVELAASLAAAQHGQIVPTRNYQHADPGCPIRVLSQPRASRRRIVVKVSCTDLGQCGAVVVRAGVGN